MNLLIAAANPIEHAVAHRLHEHWLIRMPFTLFGKDVPALNVKDGNYDFYITNHLMMTAVVAVLLVMVAMYAGSRISVHRGKGLDRFQTKGRIAQLFETICAFIRDEVARPNLHHLTDKYIYYIWTIFFFVLFAGGSCVGRVDRRWVSAERELFFFSLSECLQSFLQRGGA